ncbi:hypothetical protein JCM8547_008765 [Rhodosporidiobolus lusitaniae]
MEPDTEIETSSNTVRGKFVEVFGSKDKPKTCVRLSTRFDAGRWQVELWNAETAQTLDVLLSCEAQPHELPEDESWNWQQDLECELEPKWATRTWMCKLGPKNTLYYDNAKAKEDPVKTFSKDGLVEHSRELALSIFESPGASDIRFAFGHNLRVHNANKTILVNRSRYFRTISSSGFSKSAEILPSFARPSQRRRIDPSNFTRSMPDDDDDDAVEWVPDEYLEREKSDEESSETVSVVGPKERGTVEITDAGYITFRAIVYWLYRRRIELHPLASTFLVVFDQSLEKSAEERASLGQQAFRQLLPLHLTYTFQEAQTKPAMSYPPPLPSDMPVSLTASLPPGSKPVRDTVGLLSGAVSVSLDSTTSSRYSSSADTTSTPATLDLEIMKKGSAGEAEAGSEESGSKRSRRSPPKTPKSASPRKKKGKADVVKDDSPFPLIDLPVEIIDQILASPDLHLGDHLAHAASCRTLRSAYYTPPPSPRTKEWSSDVWRVLASNRAFRGKGWNKSPGKQAVPSEADEKLLNHLWSHENRTEPSKVVVKARAEGWEQAIYELHDQRITKSTAKAEYKLARASVLAKISYIEKRNPHSRHAAPILKKLAATAAKAADTRRKRKLGLLDSDSDKEDKKPSTPSTPSKPSKKKQRTELYGVKISSSDEDEEEDADYEYKHEDSLTPMAGPSGNRY